MRSMRQLESKNRYIFKYYAFSDDDIVSADCHSLTGCDDVPNKSSCCFDAVVYFLLSSIEYAVVNFVYLGGVPGTGGIMKLTHHSCSDGAFNAYHRAAAPALLPYVELVDRFSWWGAQGIMWSTIAGCTPRHSVFLGVFNIVHTNGHTNYPRGRYEEVENDAKEAVFDRKFKVSPWPINPKAALFQGDCTHVGLPVQTSHLVAWKSGYWLKEDAFRRCHDALKPRFDSFIRTGNISITDYIDFGSYKTVP